MESSFLGKFICVFANSRSAEKLCLINYSEDLFSGFVRSGDTENQLEDYRHDLQLNFEYLTVQNNQLRSSRAQLAIDNWVGTLEVMPAGLKIFEQAMIT